MKTSEIINYLNKNDIEQIEKIAYKDGFLVLKFYYDFDQEEINASRAYANEESDYEEESSEWYKEYFIPYLNDIATDNIGEIIEEIAEDFELQGQFVSYDMDINNYAFNQFLATFSDSEKEFDIDEIIDELDL